MPFTLFVVSSLAAEIRSSIVSGGLIPALSVVLQPCERVRLGAAASAARRRSTGIAATGRGEGGEGGQAAGPLEQIPPGQTGVRNMSRHVFHLPYRERRRGTTQLEHS